MNGTSVRSFIWRYSIYYKVNIIGKDRSEWLPTFSASRLHRPFDKSLHAMFERLNFRFRGRRDRINYHRYLFDFSKLFSLS